MFNMQFCFDTSHKSVFKRVNGLSSRDGSFPVFLFWSTIASTNLAKTALSLGEKNIPVYSTGGKLREFSYSFIGDTAKNLIRNFHGNILFFSCRCISQDLSLYDSSEDEAELRKVMMQICDKAVLLCDSSKFNQKSFYKICDFSNIDYLITKKNRNQT